MAVFLFSDWDSTSMFSGKSKEFIISDFSESRSHIGFEIGYVLNLMKKERLVIFLITILFMWLSFFWVNSSTKKYEVTVTFSVFDLDQRVEFLKSAYEVESLFKKDKLASVVAKEFDPHQIMATFVDSLKESENLNAFFEQEKVFDKRKDLHVLRSIKVDTKNNDGALTISLFQNIDSSQHAVELLKAYLYFTINQMDNEYSVRLNHYVNLKKAHLSRDISLLSQIESEKLSARIALLKSVITALDGSSISSVDIYSDIANIPLNIGVANDEYRVLNHLKKLELNSDALVVKKVNLVRLNGLKLPSLKVLILGKNIDSVVKPLQKTSHMSFAFRVIVSTLFGFFFAVFIVLFKNSLKKEER